MGLVIWLIAESYLPFGIITPAVSYATNYIIEFFYNNLNSFNLQNLSHFDIILSVTQQ